MEILRRKAEAEKFDPPLEVMAFIARHIGTNKQELEGALVRVVVYSIITNRNIDVELAEEALKEDISRGKNSQPLILSKPYFTYLVRGVAGLALCGVLLLYGCNYSNKDIVANPLVLAETPDQQATTLSGFAVPFEAVSLSPSAPGKIKEIYVQLGDYVTIGQKLAELENPDLEYRIKQAEAQVKMSQVQAHIKSIEQQISLNQAKVNLFVDASKDLEDAQSAVKELELALETDNRNWSRTKALYDEGAVSKQTLEQAETSKTLTENRLKIAKQKLETALSQDAMQKQLSQETAKLQEASDQASKQLTAMSLEQTQADLDMLRYQYSQLTVKSPINGFITEQSTVVGAAAANPLFVISNLDQVYIGIWVPEALINRIKPDQIATVTFPVLGKTVEGKVTSIGQVADHDTGNYPVKILVDNMNHEIKGGMRAQVSIK